MQVAGEGVQDLLGGFLPDKGFRVVVPGPDPVADLLFQGLHALVDTTADELVGEEPEPPLDLVEPGRAGRGEVQVDTGMPSQPGFDRRGLAGGVVVADHVNVQTFGHGPVDGGQELLELDRPVVAVQFADHGAVGDVERREQGGDAVA